jgi:UDP-2,3-diacylglucosamine pyrophosphatase LpxH
MANVHEGLTRALTGPFTITARLDLDRPHRYAILSDQHKGARDKADRFAPCEPAYRAALTHYHARGHTLVLLGDAEELWEQAFRSVERAYADILRLEGSFPADRYLRIWGNHDDEWMSPRAVRRQLSPFLPMEAVYEGLLFYVYEGGRAQGRLFLVHGHQGTFFSDTLRGVSKAVLRTIVRNIQRIFGDHGETPARDACLRGKHDQQMYDWACQQQQLILIAGHTHRPVWSSKTHLQQLEERLAGLRGAERPGDPSYAAAVQSLEVEIADRRAKSPPCNDTPKTVPCYFNTGCCIFEDGDITGIELEDGELRLVKWASGGGDGVPIALERARLADVLVRVP